MPKVFTRHRDAVVHRKPKSDRKETMIRLRVTDEQRQLMIEAAKLTGLDLSAWLRTLAVQEARKRVLRVVPKRAPVP